MKIVIVSYKRADRVLTIANFKEGDCIIACNQSDALKYKGYYQGFEILEVPDIIEGNIARKRNWVLNKINDDVLFLDDDLEFIGYNELTSEKYYQKLDRDELLHFIENGFAMAHEFGTVLWGVNVQKDPKFYREFTPFSMLSPVLGPFMGIVRNDLRFDENIDLKEDYDYFLQVVHKYHKVLRFNKYFYSAGHIDNLGGISLVRSQDHERICAERLVKKWGKSIVDIERKTQHGNETINPIIRVPIKGI